MSLVTYDEVRPYARALKYRTSLRDQPGVMPPWMLEKDIGIQGFQNDVSLSEAQIQTIAEWADGGAPLGDPQDMPPPRTWAGPDEWSIGEPDLIVRSKPFTVEAEAPDWWGAFDNVPTGLTEDRYVAAYEFHEVNDARTKEAELEGGIQRRTWGDPPWDGHCARTGRTTGTGRVLSDTRGGAERRLVRS